SANRPATARATTAARRVLPTPPGPITVTSRCFPTRPATSSTSAARPTKLVSAAAKPCTPPAPAPPLSATAGPYRQATRIPHDWAGAATREHHQAPTRRGRPAPRHTPTTSVPTSTAQAPERERPPRPHAAARTAARAPVAAKTFSEVSGISPLDE